MKWSMFGEPNGIASQRSPGLLYVQVRELFEMVNQEVQHVLQFDHRGIGV